jgi:hypothetical protein
MKKRCVSKWHAANYRDRGIRVCTGWKTSFESFLADMGMRPSATHSIDRRDNDRGYDCGHCEDCIARGATPNCRWATYEQQNRNSRRNRLITHDGVTLCAAEWSDQLGIKINTIHKRLQRGASDGRALIAQREAA